MKNILNYRGRALKTKYWIEGNLITNPECENFMIGLVVFHGSNSFDEPSSEQYEAVDVDKKTVGLVSDVPDKNKKLISVGDICKSFGNSEEHIDVVEFKNGSFVLVSKSDAYLDSLISDKSNKDIEIVGNIYENSDLLS